QVDLYELNKSTLQFDFKKTIIKDFESVDTTVVFYNNLFWLFLSQRKDSNTKLFLFFSNALDGPYSPHSNNPVKMNIRNSRPGGTPYMIDEDLYRPAQDSSRTYGGAISINKITRLSEFSFNEENLYYITPDDHSKYTKGIHTISSIGELTLIDGKHHTFVWKHFYYKLKEKISRIKPIYDK
ncbi:hypothetical protein ACFLRZ_00605, partial [Bacteroidota bacterium]